jgi:hypothetical protein
MHRKQRGLLLGPSTSKSKRELLRGKKRGQSFKLKSAVQLEHENLPTLLNVHVRADLNYRGINLTILLCPNQYAPSQLQASFMDSQHPSHHSLCTRWQRLCLETWDEEFCCATYARDVFTSASDWQRACKHTRLVWETPENRDGRFSFSGRNFAGALCMT